MEHEFDQEAAKKFLLKKSEKEKQHLEELRQLILKKTLDVLSREFKGTGVEVFLVGSIIKPFQFTSHSDVDIVLKNFVGDRFDLWTKIEDQIERNVEIILFEKCHFQDFVLLEGLKVT